MENDIKALMEKIKKTNLLIYFYHYEFIINLYDLLYYSYIISYYTTLALIGFNLSMNILYNCIISWIFLYLIRSYIDDNDINIIDYILFVIDPFYLASFFICILTLKSINSHLHPS